MYEYNICYSLDSQYTEQLSVSIVSILKNSDEKDKHNFYILDGGLTKSDKSEIELLKNIKNFNVKYIKMDNKKFKSCPLLRGKDGKYKDYHVTLPTYYRFELSEILANTDKVLYLDCDVIVRGSLKELYETDLTNQSAGMIIDSEEKKESERLGIKHYCNAGVMLINLDYWRKNNIKERFYKYAQENKSKILWQDQDIINCVLEDSLLILENKWNYQYFGYEKIETRELAESKILHLSGRFKPWLIPFEHPVYDCYYYYLGYTSKRHKVLEYKLAGNGKTLKNDIGGADTNIELKATDKDILNVYSDLNKYYSYINKAFEEITKVYEYLNPNLEKQNNEINRLYDEISKAYKYIDETKKQNEKLIKQISSNIEERFVKIYEEIRNSYQYTDNKLEKIRAEIKSREE